MYKITQWASRYEVNSGGHAYKPDNNQKIRSTPLPYVRAKVHGRQLGTGMRKLQAIAGDRHNEVFGLFMRFLEIAGDAGRGNRGHLLNSDSLDDPATPKDLAFILNSPQDQIEYALTKLIEVGWISGDSGKLPELREAPGDSGNSVDSPHLNNLTEPNLTEPNLTEPNETKPETSKGNSSSSKRDIFPEKLNTPEFRVKWEEWVVYRKEIRKKLTISTIEKQLKKLAEYSVPDAMATIDTSITNGWQGLFPERKNNEQKAKPTARTNRQRDLAGQHSNFGNTI